MQIHELYKTDGYGTRVIAVFADADDAEQAAQIVTVSGAKAFVQAVDVLTGMDALDTFAATYSATVEQH